MFGVLPCAMSYLVLFGTLIISIQVEGVKRQLDYHINPGCDIPECISPDVNKSFFNFIHVEAKGPKDTIHYLWSTFNLPSLIVVETSPAAALEVDWSAFKNLKNGALWFTEAPIQSIGFILTQIWHYVDNDDTVDMADSSTVIGLNVNEFQWNDIKAVGQLSDALITAFATSSKNESVFSDHGKFNVKFSVAAAPEASDLYPHLQFNGNSTEMQILLDNLVAGKNERFAVEFMSMSSSTSPDKWHPVVHSTIDDEYSPGVFSVYELFPPCSNCEAEKSFLTWKPVAYLGQVPTVANSSDAVLSELAHRDNIAPSIASMFFNNTENITKIAYNMTFGTSKDGGYDHTKYTSWSIMIGTGEPILEEISLLAKIVIGVGLGAPCFIMVGGGLYLGYIKFCKSKDDDELLLDG